MNIINMVTLRSRKKNHYEKKVQPLRTANQNTRSGANVCEVINKKACKILRKDQQVYVTNIGNQAIRMGNIEREAYQSADIYINESVYDVNPRSKIFISRDRMEDGVFVGMVVKGKKYLSSFNRSITKRWVIIKICLPGHYTVALVDQQMKKIDCLLFY